MPKAKYTEIYKDLKSKIEAGEYKFQELLPSENQLVHIYDCSRNTIRRAVSALVSDGYLQTMQGKGIRNIFQPTLRTFFTIGASNLLRNLPFGIIRLPKQKSYSSQSLRLEKLDSGRSFMPDAYRELCMEGGNHAQFGDYGTQKGDHPASVSREEQQAQTADAVINMILETAKTEETSMEYEKITAQKAKDLILQKDGICILDVRTREEY